jgi:hypothetical protein
MTTRLHKIPLLIFCLAICELTNAQIIPPVQYNTCSHEFFVSLSLKPEITTMLGYQSRTNKTSKGLLALGTSFEFAPLIVVKNQALKWNIFSQLHLPFGNAHFFATPQVYLAHAKDRSATYNTVGAELPVVIAWYNTRGIKGLTMGWQHGFVTHIKHSKVSKGTFDERYEDTSQQVPQNGWYRSTVDRFKIGFSIARSISRSVNFQTEIGTIVSLQKQGVYFGLPYGQIPIYISGTLVYHRQR